MKIRELMSKVFLSRITKKVELEPSEVNTFRAYCIRRKAKLTKIRRKRKQLRTEAKKLRKHTRPRRQGAKRRRRKSREKGSK